MSFFHPPQARAAVIRTLQAVLLHESRSHNGGPQAHWLTTHAVEEQESGPLIGPGRLLSEEDKRALIETLVGTLPREEFAVLPPHVLAMGAVRIAWYVPGRVRAMHFNIKSRTFSLQVPWPTLVFLVSEGQLSLAALAEVSRPEAHTPLFHAPLMNLNEATRLCTGNAIVPRGSGLADCAGYEQAVYDTNFSHVNHPHTLRGAKAISNEAHVRFWRGLARTKAKAFPTDALVPLKRTLSAWLTD